MRRLLRRRSVRQAEGAFVMEGPTLLATALDAGAAVESVFVAPEALSRPEVAGLLDRALGEGARVFELGPGVLERVADTVTPQPVLAVVRTPTPADGLEGRSFVVVCVDVRDPGNTGAVIRAADAAGADAVICCAGTADPWNPKTVRASAGSVLHLPVFSGDDPRRALVDLGRSGFRRLAAVAHGGTAYTDADLTGPVAVVLGNEADGVPDELLDEIDGRITVPMAGRAESLNVSLASAVLLFEVRRQRSNLHGVEDAR
ncbi:MAG TPA: RNA methyltransferase [Acidimicrobiales bacterium]|nr:RNA methyltransferase [Acidimicrobiales bacterium]